MKVDMGAVLFSLLISLLFWVAHFLGYCQGYTTAEAKYAEQRTMEKDPGSSR